MEISREFLHDRVVLILTTIMSVLTVIGVSIVFLRFDAAKSATTTIAYRQNVAGIVYQPGKPIDIYLLAVFMLATAIGGLVLANHIYPARRSVSIFVLGSADFLLVLAAIVANSLILLQ